MIDQTRTRFFFIILYIYINIQYKLFETNHIILYSLNVFYIAIYYIYITCLNKIYLYYIDFFSIHIIYTYIENPTANVSIPGNYPISTLSRWSALQLLEPMYNIILYNIPASSVSIFIVYTS